MKKINISLMTFMTFLLVGTLTAEAKLTLLSGASITAFYKATGFGGSVDPLTIQHLNENYFDYNYTPFDQSYETIGGAIQDSQDVLDLLKTSTKCGGAFDPQLMVVTPPTDKNVIQRRNFSLSIVAQTFISVPGGDVFDPEFILYDVNPPSKTPSLQPQKDTYAVIEFNDGLPYFTQDYDPIWGWPGDGWSYHGILIHETLHAAGMGHNTQLSAANPSLYKTGDPSELPALSVQDANDIEFLNGCQSLLAVSARPSDDYTTLPSIISPRSSDNTK